VLERKRDNLRFLLDELEGWKESELITCEQHETLAKRYKERLDLIEKETTGEDAVYLEEAYGTWLVRLGTMAVLAAFSIIAAYSMGWFTSGQKVLLTFLGSGLFCGLAIKLRSALRETLSNALLFIGGSLLVAAIGLLYSFDFVGAGVEALLQLGAAVALVKLAERFDSIWVLIEGMSTAVGAGTLLYQEVLPEIVVLLCAAVTCAWFAHRVIERSPAALAYDLFVSFFVLGFLAWEILEILQEHWTNFHWYLIPLSLLIYSVILLVTAPRVKRKHGGWSAVPFYLAGCAGTAIMWGMFVLDFSRAMDFTAPVGLGAVTYLPMGIAFLRWGRQEGETVVIAAGGLVLLFDLTLVANVLELPPAVAATLLLLAGVGVLFAAWRFDVRRRELLAALGASEEKDDKLGDTAEGAMEGVGALLER
jgi:hypothetical protein